MQSHVGNSFYHHFCYKLLRSRELKVEKEEVFEIGFNGFKNEIQWVRARE